MTKTGKQGTAGAAARVRAKFAARQARVVEGVTAAEQAWADRAEAIAGVESAEDRLRDAVAGLVAEDVALSEIAEFTGVPIEAVRAARRPKQSGESPAEKPASPVGREPARGSGDGQPGSPGPDDVVQLPPPPAAA